MHYHPLSITNLPPDTAPHPTLRGGNEIQINRKSIIYTMYKLSKTLLGHEQDVRSVASFGDKVISSSRDGTIRLWDQNNGTIIFNSSTNSFINAVCVLPNGLYASGGKDNVVFVNPIDTTEPTDMGMYNLIGHQNNICHLHSAENMLISSSWDGTARVWDLEDYTCKWVLRHESKMSILASLVVNKSTFLTCSADKTIGLWSEDNLVKSFIGHGDVVRNLVVLSDTTFASCANDGTIKIWQFNGQLVKTLPGHDSFIYDVVLLPNGHLVSCGEDRTVRVWDLNAGSVLQVITLPCVSNWCLTNIDDDIVVGSSDNTIRVFTAQESKFASPQELASFEESIRTSTIAEQSVDINKTDVPGYEKLDEKGKEGQTIMVKNPSGVIEAHQWSNNQWNKIGDVVSASGSGTKKEYAGKSYDYVFDVDIEDGKPPLKLPYNAADNVYTVANQFLADNELPNSYVQDIVNFLETNTQGASITEARGPTEVAEPSESPASTSASPKPSIVPVTSLITFKDVNSNQLSKGLSKFNESQANKVQIPFSFDVSSSEAVEIITSTVPQIFEASSYLIGFDLLRALIPKLGISDILKTENLPELILSYIKQGLTSENPTVLMMMLKFLCNLTESVLFVQIFVTTETSLTYSDELVSLLEVLHKKDLNKSHKHYGQYLVSYSTFLFDLSVTNLSKKITYDLSKFISETNNDEANYRLLIAFGNLKYGKSVSGSLKWGGKHQEKRFVDLLKDIQRLDGV